MGGMLGFGKKGERGVDYVVTLPDGGEAHLPFVFGRSCWAEYALKKNPLLGLKRRRGNANVVWDLKPVDNTYFRASKIWSSRMVGSLSHKMQSRRTLPGSKPTT